jgi:heme/copper-type cytochrome/quinol oxidase subunit 2
MVVLMTRTSTVLFTLAALTGVVAGATAASLSARLQQKAQVVDIVVERFSFTPSEFRVPAGMPVEIRLRSDDTDHGFRIVGTNVNATIPKRGKGIATVIFQPPAAGKYVFECSKLCGAGHEFMRGQIIAE